MVIVCLLARDLQLDSTFWHCSGPFTEIKIFYVGYLIAPPSFVTVTLKRMLSCTVLQRKGVTGSWQLQLTYSVTAPRLSQASASRQAFLADAEFQEIWSIQSKVFDAKNNYNFLLRAERFQFFLKSTER